MALSVDEVTSAHSHKNANATYSIPAQIVENTFFSFTMINVLLSNIFTMINDLKTQKKFYFHNIVQRWRLRQIKKAPKEAAVWRRSLVSPLGGEGEGGGGPEAE